MKNDKWMTRQIKRAERYSAQGKFSRAQACLNAVKGEISKQQREVKDNEPDKK